MTVQLDLEEACLQLFSLNGLKCHLTDFSRAASCRNSETKGASIPWELAQHPVSGRSQHLLYEVLTFLCSECGMGDPDSPSMGPSVKVFFLLYFIKTFIFIVSAKRCLRGSLHPFLPPPSL